ncbi:MAG: UDP-N-acetylmuramoyl-L-alanyl-D-glutamate--2,6-diaminopimelate ligase [Lachnospiraceae bacterium]|nr:UDP-N-acetylmuramoyl-L-alanyl-D-glutamate--2,6-diaminopimelate ligase [Lachnospiraceae bacterium]
MLLKDMLQNIPCTLLGGSQEIEVTGLSYDSRKVQPGDAFVCISGLSVDAHTFIPQAVEKGAAAVIVTKDVDPIPGVTIVRVENARRALALMAKEYFGRPDEKLTTIGITGTKGKTTTSYMLRAMLEHAGHKVGVIGSIGAVIGDREVKTSNTTPESYEIYHLFAQMVEEGCEYCVMEVSSQGLKMDRVAGILFDYGIFTNFSDDHIGPTEHKDMAEYLYCKSLLFRQCKVGIINRDSPYWQGVTEGHTCAIETFGFEEGADLLASNHHFRKDGGALGVEFDVSGALTCHVVTDIPGRFSAYNSMTALAIGRDLGIPLTDMLAALKTIRVPGRVELIDVSPKFSIMVDYAHNAVSTESVITAMREYNPHRVICVFGCGGNRSKVRRYEIGEICGKMADFSIVTSDNSRFEEVEDIMADIRIGLDKGHGKYIEIPDRAEAIYYSMDHAEEGDVILVLGKGHEDYQEIKGVKYHFSDQETILKWKQERLGEE